MPMEDKRKFIPHHDGASGNLPPIGDNAPGVNKGGTRPTAAPNSNGVMTPAIPQGGSAPKVKANPY